MRTHFTWFRHHIHDPHASYRHLRGIPYPIYVNFHSRHLGSGLHIEHGGGRWALVAEAKRRDQGSSPTLWQYCGRATANGYGVSCTQRAVCSSRYQLQDGSGSGFASHQAGFEESAGSNGHESGGLRAHARVEHRFLQCDLPVQVSPRIWIARDYWWY